MRPAPPTACASGFLSGVRDSVVVDMGGTTSDVGVLAHGFPREASAAVRWALCCTNFHMPDVYSFGLGGGSHVQTTPLHRPQSVGYAIASQAHLRRRRPHRHRHRRGRGPGHRR
ncbi:MAG: hydantoinase/oxoprolinase family protein [Caldilineaceae bacterium]